MDTITTIQSLLRLNGSVRPATAALTPNEIRLIAAAPTMLDYIARKAAEGDAEAAFILREATTKGA